MSTDRLASEPTGRLVLTTHTDALPDVEVIGDGWAVGLAAFQAGIEFLSDSKATMNRVLAGQLDEDLDDSIMFPDFPGEFFTRITVLMSGGHVQCNVETGAQCPSGVLRPVLVLDAASDLVRLGNQMMVMYADANGLEAAIGGR